MVTERRKKPKFYRVEWHKKIRLGSTRKKKRTWRRSTGRHNKIRMNLKGRSHRPKVGWGADKKFLGQINDLTPILIETKQQLEKVQKGFGIIISGNLGKKKRTEMIKIANEKKIPILNRYKPKENATK